MTANDLPRALDTFIGRESETAEIATLVAAARLFTLTGPGGSGKTRLAARVAGRVWDTFRDGVRWVDLSAVVDPPLLPYAVAARCGVSDHANPAVLDALSSALRPLHLLLVLDNCEHVLDESARLIEALLVACPELHVLATSREHLAIPGEVIWQVRPLSVPDRDILVAGEDPLAYEAVQLFVTRATAVLPEFALTAENTANVIRICRRVEGLPLALELAAARLRVLSLAELAERLGDANRVLTGGGRTAHPRQQTFRATLDWSYDLLTEDEQAVFRQLAVFAGGFTLDAAEMVCVGAGVADANLLELLAHLVEKSLVTVQDRTDETRYRLLEPLRQYAHDRLARTNAVARAGQRHRDWYAAFASQAAQALESADQARWFDRLESEHDNLRAALGWSLADGDGAVAGQIVSDIWTFWLLRGYLHEGRNWLERILEASPQPTPQRAQLLWIAGILARPDVTLARQRFIESLTLWKTLGDQEGIGRVASTLGYLAQAEANHQQAMTYFDQSIPIVRASSDTPALARLLSSMSLSLLEAGDMERATATCLEGLALHEEAGDLRGVAAAMTNLGLIQQARGDTQQATELWQRSLSQRRKIGDTGGVAHVLQLLGSLAVEQGESARATGLLYEGLSIRRQTGSHEGIATILDGLAAVLADQNDQHHAVLLASAADALRAATGMPPSTRERAAHHRIIAILQANMSEQAFARPWNDGQALTLDQAVAVVEQFVTRATDPGQTTTAPDHSPSVPEPEPDRRYALTERETEVLRLITLGLTYAQIGEALFISPRTVDAHMRSIYSKLDVHSRSAATRIAIQQRLV